jgi:hypothetical protein
MRKIKKITKAYTLVEIVLYFGLMSMFLLVLVYIFTSSLSIKLESESSSAIVSDANYILSRVSYDLNNADSVTVPEATTLQFTKNLTTYSYSLNNGNLVLTEGGVSAKLNGEDTGIDNIAFTKIGNAGGKATVQIIFTLSSKIQGNEAMAPQTFQTTVGLR